jgi:hypothetical protein
VRVDGESGRRERVLKLASRPLFELRDAGFLNGPRCHGPTVGPTTFGTIWRWAPFTPELASTTYVPPTNARLARSGACPGGGEVPTIATPGLAYWPRIPASRTARRSSSTCSSRLLGWPFSDLGPG